MSPSRKGSKQETEAPSCLNDVPKETITSIISSDDGTISEASLMSVMKEEAGVIAPSLAPRDGGRAAYTVLVAAIIVDSFILGFPIAFGVFQDYYLETHILGNASNASLIGLLSLGLPFLAAPLMTYVCESRPILRASHCIWAGWSICVLALVAAAFFRTIAPILVFQGVLYGIGVMLVDVPLIIILNSWFIDHRGLAIGLIFAGADVLCIGWTFFLTFTLRHLGLRTSLLISAAILFALPGPAIFFLKERSPPGVIMNEVTLVRQTSRRLSNTSLTTTRTSPPSSPPTHYLSSPTFYLLALSNLSQALASELPQIYLPTLATAAGLSTSQGATLLSLASIGLILGEIILGPLSDILPVSTLAAGSSIIATAATFGLLGFSCTFLSPSTSNTSSSSPSSSASSDTTMTMLSAFAVLFGTFGGGFLVFWSRMGLLFGEKDAQMVYSAMSFGRGFGSIVSGPIAAALVRRGQQQQQQTGSNGGSWRGLAYPDGEFAGFVTFVGVCLAASAVLAGLAQGCWGWERRRSGFVQMIR